jgi:hypothetical protein
MMELAKECLADPRRSGFKAQLICTTIDLVEKADKQRQHSPREPYHEYEHMSNEELQRSFFRYLKKALKNKPTIAVEGLRQLGWTVIPPEQ